MCGFDRYRETSMSYFFKVRVLPPLLLAITSMFIYGQHLPANFNKAAFYTAMASQEATEVNRQLEVLRETSAAEKLAYEGALLMKKAGLVSKPKEKLNLFKSGRSKLEAAIKDEDANIEFRFLRLIVQERSPKIVRYKGDIKTDAELVRQSFKDLPPVVQQAVRDFSKVSKSLSPGDFN